MGNMVPGSAFCVSVCVYSSSLYPSPLKALLDQTLPFGPGSLALLPIN